MPIKIPYGSRSTADEVLAGVDLSGRRILLTGCTSGIGRATLNALAANGAEVIGLARSLTRAQEACSEAGSKCIPIECDLADLRSVAAATQAIRALGGPLDAIIANAGIAAPATLSTRYGIELQFLTHHVGHFALVNRLLDRVRNLTGRIVVVSSSAMLKRAPADGIAFDNLDGQKGYDPQSFYAQSKLAVAVYAKELSRRLLGRGISANSVHPGLTQDGPQSAGSALNWVRWAGRPFRKQAPQAAATPALLAASPRVAGVSGEFWSDCQIANGHPKVSDPELAARLWRVSEEIVAANAPTDSSLQAAA